MPTESHTRRGSDVGREDVYSRWLISAAQTMPIARHAGTAPLERPSPPASGTSAASTAVTRQAPTSRIVTETEGRAVSSGDMST